jgi:hypothetical protein
MKGRRQWRSSVEVVQSHSQGSEFEKRLKTSKTTNYRQFVVNRAQGNTQLKIKNRRNLDDGPLEKTFFF